MTPQDESVVSPSHRVIARPPAMGSTYWRVTVLDPTCRRRIRQTTGGLTREDAERAVARIESRLAPHAPAGATATRGSDLLNHFMDPRRPKNLGRPNRPAAWS